MGCAFVRPSTTEPSPAPTPLHRRAPTGLTALADLPADAQADIQAVSAPAGAMDYDQDDEESVALAEILRDNDSVSTVATYEVSVRGESSESRVVFHPSPDDCPSPTSTAGASKNDCPTASGATAAAAGGTAKPRPALGGKVRFEDGPYAVSKDPNFVPPFTSVRDFLDG